MKRIVFVLFASIFLRIGLVAQQYVMLAKKTSETEKDASSARVPNAAVFEFDVYSKVESSHVDPQLVENHFMGNEIAQKMYQFDRLYTYETKIAPGNPASTTNIRKPVVYNSVKRIESFLKKSVRKHEISMDMAVVQFNKVLDVALNTLYQNTNAFENEIKLTSNTSDLVELYTQRVHLNYDK